MQHEVTKRQRLLDKNGLIREPGFARKMVWRYNREYIHAPRFKIKEWDYYLVGNEDFAVAFTISDLGYLGLCSVSFLNLAERWEKTNTLLDLMPMGNYRLGLHSSYGDARFRNKKVLLSYHTEPGKRYIFCKYPKFYQGMDFEAKICLEQKDTESICIATPWKKKPTAFYYNQKIPCMPARGYVKLGEKTYRFSPKRDFGVLDWGRGVWTYSNVWYWCIGSGSIDGVPFGFNLGYGFSDRSSATENVLYYNGKVHKLAEVDFGIPKKSKKTYDYDYMEPWQMTSSDGRFEGVLTPVLDRKADINAGLVASRQHQIFGKITGKAVLDDSTVIDMKEFPCAVEVIRNRY
jgi:hypothetical protein